MATAVHSRAYRQRKKTRDDTLIQLIQGLIEKRYASLSVTLHEVKQELIAQRDAARVTVFASPPLDSPLKNPSDKESHKRGKKERESEQARLARLEAWTPNETCRNRAYAEGHDDAWIDRQAEMYRCQQVNAKVGGRHSNFNRGFLKWILSAPLFERKPNGSGRQRELSPVDTLYAGAFDAVRELEERERQRNRH